jgi:hypothetical protein
MIFDFFFNEPSLPTKFSPLRPPLTIRFHGGCADSAHINPLSHSAFDQPLHPLVEPKWEAHRRVMLSGVGLRLTSVSPAAAHSRK